MDRSCLEYDEEDKENGYEWKRLEEKYLRLPLRYCICGCIQNIQNWHSSQNDHDDHVVHDGHDDHDDHDDHDGQDDHDHIGGGREGVHFLFAKIS